MTDPFAGATATLPAGGDPFGAAAQPGEDPFGGPAPKEAKAPRIMDLGVGRLVMVRATRPSETVPDNFNVGQMVQRMTCDLVALDGGVIQYGGKPEKGIPHTILDKSAPIGWRQVWIGQKGLVDQVQPKFGSPKPWALGRLYQGPATKGNPPWLLGNPTEADAALARTFLATHPEFR